MSQRLFGPGGSMRQLVKRVLLFIFPLVNRCYFSFYFNSVKLGRKGALSNLSCMSLLGENVLVLAPHIDDDIIGCGGAILEYLERGKSVNIVYLTGGGLHGSQGLSESAIIAERKEEAWKVAALLNLPRENLHFLKAEDGNLLHCEIPFLRTIIQDINPDAIFLPCSLDTHNDHYAVSQKLFELFQADCRALTNCCLYLYEAQSPLTPFYSNIALNISRFASRKSELMNVYRSQGNFNFTRELNKINAIPYKKCAASELYININSNQYFQWYAESHRFNVLENYLKIKAKLLANRDSMSLIKSFKSSYKNKRMLKELLLPINQP